MKTFLKPGLVRILITFALFALSSYLWRIYITSIVSDAFPWGFPLSFYNAWGPCPPGENCSESNIFFLLLDVAFWHIVSGFLASSFGRTQLEKEAMKASPK